MLDLAPQIDDNSSMNDMQERVIQARADAEWLTSLITPGADCYHLYQAALNNLLMEIAGDDRDIYEEISDNGFTMTRAQIEKSY